MVAVLRDLHSLAEADPSLLDTLREARFVPTADGTLLKRPSELFHPRVQQAAELLGMSGAFPSGPFGSAEVLSTLERLGLRSEVTRSAVLQSARSIEELSATDGDAAAHRARALLRYMDMHASSLRDDSAGEDDASPAADPYLGQRVVVVGLSSRADLNGQVGLVVDAYGESRYTVHMDASDPVETLALRPVNLRLRNAPVTAPGRSRPYEVLLHVRWLPVLTAPPHPRLPWRESAANSSVASPDSVRPVSDAWLVSHCAHLLDSDVVSPFLQQLFGWDRPPRASLLCAQLAELGAGYVAELGPRETQLLDDCVCPIYDQVGGRLSIYTYLSVCLSIHPSICLSTYLSICLPIYLLSVWLSVCLSAYPSIYLSIDISSYRSIYFPIYRSIFIHPSIHPYIHTYKQTYIYLSISRSIDPSVYRSVYLSVSRSIDRIDRSIKYLPTYLPVHICLSIETTNSFPRLVPNYVPQPLSHFVCSCSCSRLAPGVLSVVKTAL